MIRPWQEIIADPRYQALAPAEKEQARAQYFQEAIAPNLDPSEYKAGFQEFTAQDKALTEQMQPSIIDSAMQGLQSLGNTALEFFTGGQPADPSGNPIDTSRPILNNPDGSFSTERTIGIQDGNKFVNIPTIVDGKQRSPDEAIQLYRQGKNPSVGVFNSQAEADQAAVARSAEIGRVRGGDNVIPFPAGPGPTVAPPQPLAPQPRGQDTRGGFDPSQVNFGPVTNPLPDVNGQMQGQQFPTAPPPAPESNVPGYLKTAGQSLLDAGNIPAVAEAATNIISSLAGQSAGGLAGLGTIATNSLGLTNTKPEKVVKSVSETIAQPPRRPAAKRLVKTANAPFEALPALAEKAAQANKEAGGNPATETAISTLIQGAPFLIGGRGLSVKAAASRAQKIAANIKQSVKFKEVTKDIPAEDIAAAIVGKSDASPEATAFVKGLSREDKVAVAKASRQGVGQQVKQTVGRFNKKPQGEAVPQPVNRPAAKPSPEPMGQAVADIGAAIKKTESKPQATPAIKTAPEPTAPAPASKSAPKPPATEPLPTGEPIATAPKRKVEKQDTSTKKASKQGKSEVKVFTPSGTEVSVRPQIVSADALVTSHDATGRVNPAFPSSLQPRDRKRAASQVQVQNIASKLNPELLGASKSAAEGAPIISSDGVVESGNGRVNAIRIASKGKRGPAYRKFVQEQADALGVDISGIKNPVLVRVRTTPLDDAGRLKFVKDANESNVAQMSATEKASGDAKALDGVIEKFRPSDTGEINTAGNRDFIRAFMDTVPANERPALQTEDGVLNQDGINRVRNALFKKAYGSDSLVSKVAESTDPGIKNVLNALTKNAGNMAQLNSRVKAGTLHDVSIGPDIAQAAETFAEIQRQGSNAEAFFKQDSSDMFRKGSVSPEAAAIIRFFDANKRSGKRIADFLRRYTEVAEKTGNPKQSGLLGDSAAPKKIEIIRQAASEKNLDLFAPKQDMAAEPESPNFFGGKPLSVADNPEALKVFNNMARQQRGAPEAAMLDIQHGVGGGVYGYVAERVGDLTNRMAKDFHITHDMGRGYVADKTKTSLRSLENSFGFEREHNDNMEANFKLLKEGGYQNIKSRKGVMAAFNGKLPKTVAEFKAGIKRLGKAYAKAHEELPVYNRAQYVARQAAIDLGNYDFDAAAANLRLLIEWAKDKKTWAAKAEVYYPGPDGRPLEYRKTTASKERRTGETVAESPRFSRSNGTGGVAELYNNFETEHDIELYIEWMKEQLFNGETIRHIPKAVDDFMNGRTPSPKQAALFSRLRRAALQDKPALANIEAKVRMLTKNWKNAPKVTVLKSPKDAPFDAPSDADGAYFNGDVYVFSDRISSVEQLKRVVAHEIVGHSASRLRLGDDYNAFLDQLYKSKTGEIDKLGKKLGFDTEALDGRREAADEFIAHAAETKEPLLARIVNAALRVIEKALAKLGIRIKFARTELSDLLRENRAFVKGEISKQKTKVLDKRYKRAAKAKPTFDRQLKEIAADVSGEPLTADLKGRVRAEAKIKHDYNGDSERIKDILRGTIVTTSIKDALAAAKEVAEKYEVVGKPRVVFDNPELKEAFGGYQDAKFNVSIGGEVAEVQVNFRSMIIAKAMGHDIYAALDDMRRLDDAGDSKAPADYKKIEKILVGVERTVYGKAAELEKEDFPAEELKRLFLSEVEKLRQDKDVVKALEDAGTEASLALAKGGKALSQDVDAAVSELPFETSDTSLSKASLDMGVAPVKTRDGLNDVPEGSTNAPLSSRRSGTPSKSENSNVKAIKDNVNTTPEEVNAVAKELANVPEESELRFSREKKDAPQVGCGDCYKAAADYVLDKGIFTGTDLKVVHGIVSGRGGLKGVRLEHAWVEDGDTVIDTSNGHDIKMPKDVYYALGEIKPGELHTYDFEALRKNLLDHEHYGPWEKPKGPVTELDTVRFSRTVDEIVAPPKKGGIRKAYTEKVGKPLYNKLEAAVVPLLSKIKMASAVPEEFKIMMRQYRAQVGKDIRKAGEVADALSVLSLAERELISDYIEGEVKAGIVPPQHIVDVATQLQAAIKTQSTEALELGMLKKKTIERFGDHYLPRFYMKHAGENRFDKMLRRRFMKIDGSQMKGRGLFDSVKVADVDTYRKLGWEVRDDNVARLAEEKQIDLVEQRGEDEVLRDMPQDKSIIMWRDFTPAERERMGEIRDASYRYVRGFLRMSKDLALGRLFKAIATSGFAQKEFSTGLVQVPNTTIPNTGGLTRYGQLSGLWVPADVMDQLEVTVHERGLIEGAYMHALSLWKEGKTALNPVVHSNNIWTSWMMADFAGISPLDVKQYHAALKEYTGKGKLYQEAIDNGLFGTEFYGNEIKALLPALDQFRDIEMLSAGVIRKTADFAARKTGASSYRKHMGRLYQAEDQFFKMLIYRHVRLEGGSIDEAITEAERYIFNYMDIPKGVRAIKNSPIGLPFFSYTYKAAPAMLHTAMTQPWKIAKWAFLISGFNWAAYQYLFGDEGSEQESRERKVLPEYQKGRTPLGTQKSIRLPYNGKNGEAMFLDLSRRMPMGDLFDASNQMGGIGVLQPLVPNNPVFTTALAMFANKDSFTGRDVTKDSDSAWDKAQKRAGWLVRQALPNSPVLPFSYSWDKVMNGIASETGKPIPLIPGRIEYTGQDYYGRETSLPMALANVLAGFKVRAVDTDKARRSRLLELNHQLREAASEIRSTQRNLGLSDAVKETRNKASRKKIERIRNKIDEFR